MNAHKGESRKKMLVERRESIQATIKQLQDALFIIDFEILEGS